MLRVRDLHAGYGGITVLSGIDLDIGAGEIVAILGRNGAGKSTLLRAIVGLLPVRSGTVSLDGHNELTRLPTHARARAGLAYVPQGRQIFPRLSVLDNLRAAALAVGHDPASGIAAVLDQFPILKDKLRAQGASLSGGQQQILALARALVTRPRLLLLDEPTEGIQPSIVDAIAEHVRDINTRSGVSVLLVEQNLEFAAELAIRAYVLDKGTVVRELPPAAVLQDLALQHEYLGV
jgi:urea ABC transporter ATP-binding protein UrtE